ncbi:hypothetical protein ACVWW9_002638 [Agrococcus sp. UYP33]
MDWLSPIAVGFIAAIAAVVVGVFNTQRVPPAIRQIDKLAAAAHAIGPDEQTKAELNAAIRAQLAQVEPARERAKEITIRLFVSASVAGTLAAVVVLLVEVVLALV